MDTIFFPLTLIPIPYLLSPIPHPLSLIPYPYPPRLEEENRARMRDPGRFGLAEPADLRPWGSKACGLDDLKVMDDTPEMKRILRRSALLDPSRPSVANCLAVMGKRGFFSNLVTVGEVLVSSAPHTREKLQRRLHKGGPVIGSVRLTWDFLVFQGSLFNPPGKQTFCRMYRAGDPEDYCDPRSAQRWDQEQRDQQAMPQAVARDAWVDTWYNHFVTLHGWGRTREGVPYWVVENSWGRIYANDPALGNNGAGPRYGAGKTGLNSFLLVADRVAGAGGLEVTSREVFMAAKE
jgi:hypothetical protein